MYVQHRMRSFDKQLYSLLVEQGGHVFVCGDGAAMAKDVHTCLLEILMEEGGLTAVQAAEQLTDLTQQHRYVRDIWS